MAKITVKQLFKSEWQFICGAYNIHQVPDTKYPEVAFIGASNVGKSSLINSLVGRKIAITSKTPGRTQQLNFFLLGNTLMLVDLPGFGYAKAGKKQIENWQKAAVQYLSTRQNLKRVFLLVDPIKGLKEHDKEMANIFNTLAVSFQIILTKSDKIKDQELQNMIRTITAETKLWPALYPQILTTSSLKGHNINELQNAIFEIL